MSDLPCPLVGKQLGVEWLCPLGQGGFGQVFKAREIETGNIIAVKAIRPDPEDPLSEEHHRQEVELHSIVSDHPNIVTIHNSYESPDGIMWICMDLCEGGDLKQCLNEAHQDGIQFSESLIWSLFSQLVSAIRNCHDPDSRTGEDPDPRIILHRDLKPENILLNHERTLLKLADFGLAIALEVDEFAHSLCGTTMYQAPEILEDDENRAYDQSGDEWALGCILYELCCLRPPFMAKHVAQLGKLIKAEAYEPIPSTYSELLSQLIASLLQKDPNDRMQFRELLLHPGVQLGFAETRAMEASANVDILEEKLSQHEDLVQAYEVLEANNQVLQKKLERQTARHQNKTNALRSIVDSLESQLDEARIFSQKRGAALDSRETALRAREEACDNKHASLKRKQQALETKTKSQQAEAVALAAQQAKLDEQLNQVDEKLRSLARREQIVRRQEPAIKKVSSESSAPIVKPANRTTARSTERLPSRLASRPAIRSEVTRPVAPNSKSAPVARSAPLRSAPIPKAVEAGLAEKGTLHARHLKDIATQSKASGSTIARAIPGKSIGISTTSLPICRNNAIPASMNAKLTSSTGMTSIKPATKRSAQEILATADARIAESRQAIMERNDKAKSAVVQPTASKGVVRSARNLRNAEDPDARTVSLDSPRHKWSAEDVRRDARKEEDKLPLPHAAIPKPEITLAPPAQTNPLEKPTRSGVIAPKRARPSLIPMSNRLRSRFLPRAITLAA